MTTTPLTDFLTEKCRVPEFKDFKKKKLHELSGISVYSFLVKGPLKKRKQAKVLRCTIDYPTTTRKKGKNK